MMARKKTGISWYLNGIPFKRNVSEILDTEDIKVFVNEQELKNITDVEYDFKQNILFVDIDNKVTIALYPEEDLIDVFVGGLIKC